MVLSDQHPRFEEGALTWRTIHPRRLHLTDPNADAFDETSLHVDRLEQRQRGELAGQQPSAAQLAAGDAIFVQLAIQGITAQAQLLRHATHVPLPRLQHGQECIALGIAKRIWG